MNSILGDSIWRPVEGICRESARSGNGELHVVVKNAYFAIFTFDGRHPFSIHSDEGVALHEAKKLPKKCRARVRSVTIAWREP